MAYALGFFAFFGLMIAQALGALFSRRYPWHPAKEEHSERSIPLVWAEEPHQAPAE